MKVFLNGRLLAAAEARVPVLDHGLLYGDGLFETVRLEDGAIFRLDRHLRRLRESAARLALPVPWTDLELETALRATAAANGLEEAALRLTVTRGEGPPVPDPAGCGTPSLLVTARPAPAPDPDTWARGKSAVFTFHHPRTFVPGMKWLGYLPFQQARLYARAQGYDDGLLMDGQSVVEASAGNFFVVLDGGLLTPGLESGCLPGVTREAVLELAEEQELPTWQAPVTLTELAHAREAFTTSSVTGITPVTRMNGSAVGAGEAGPVTRRLHEALRERIRREAAGQETAPLSENAQA